METESPYWNLTGTDDVSEGYSELAPKNRTGIQYPKELLDAGIGFFIIVTIVGTAGNFISILALSRCPRLRTATTAFIINLCVADMIFCMFSSPIQAVTYVERDWTFGDGKLCKLFPFVSYANALASLFTVVAITINRYICIVHPMWYSRIYRPRNIVVMISALWISVFGLLSLPLFEVWGKFGYDTQGRTCDILVLNGKSPKTILFSVALAVPSVAFIVCYLRIYWVVRRVSNKIKFEDARGLSSDGLTEDTSSTSQAREALQKSIHVNNSKDQTSQVPKGKSTRKDLKVLKMILVIFLTYLLCYFPVSLLKILKKEEEVPFLNIFGYFLAYLANCINPIIYIALSQEYRKAYIALFTCNET